MNFYKYLCYFILILIVFVNRLDVSKALVFKDYVYTGKEILLENDIDVDEVSYDSSEVQYGKLSRYGPDCYLCSGYLAYGIYVGNGNIYYNDVYYGRVRILAGDKLYPFGTIVKISYDDVSFLGIVLDRGGAIGFNKVALFDLLYSSESLANIDGVNYNVKFEILRYGF